MLASYPPFYDEDAMKIYSKIMNGQIAYPSHFSKEAIDLIRRLLHPKPTKRLGVTANSVQQIKSHPWFANFDWDALASRRMQAPIVMSIKSDEDLSNFDSYGDDDAPVEPYVPDPKNPDWDKEF